MTRIAKIAREQRIIGRPSEIEIREVGRFGMRRKFAGLEGTGGDFKCQERSGSESG